MDERPGRQSSILIVDDDERVRRAFVAALERAGHRTYPAASAQAALQLLRDRDVDVALLDLEMPERSGLELLRQVRADPRNAALAVVVVSGDGQLESKLAALDAGANDYLVKPIALRELQARVGAQLRDRSRWLDRLDSELTTRWERRLSELDSDRDPGVLEQQLHEVLASALPLRSLQLRTGIAAEELRIERSGGGAWLHVPLRTADGDVGQLHVTVAGDVARCTSTLVDLSPVLAELLDQPALRQRSADTDAWLAERTSPDGLRPVFQPIVSLPSRRLIGVEGLSRFADGARPDLVFAEAARRGVAAELEVAAAHRLVEAAHLLPAGVWLSLNLSASTLLSGAVDDLLAASERPLTVELTENESVGDYAELRQHLARYPDVRVAVDDAGAGYASLRHVFELQPQLLKLDRHWVAGIDRDPVRQALVTGLLGFARSFGAEVIAEGVETEQEEATLRALDIPLAQGYLFARPAPPHEVRWAVGGTASA